jgi:hypothetical protein
MDTQAEEGEEVKPDWHWLDHVENDDGTFGAYYWIEEGRVFDEDAQEIELTEEDALDGERKWLQQAESAPINDQLHDEIQGYMDQHGVRYRQAYKALAKSGPLVEHHSQRSAQVQGAHEDYVRHAGRKPSAQAGAGDATEYDREQIRQDSAQVAEQDARAAREARIAEIEDGDF